MVTSAKSRAGKGDVRQISGIWEGHGVSGVPPARIELIKRSARGGLPTRGPRPRGVLSEYLR